MTDKQIPWGPTGELVYNRTYSRTKPDGTKETWPETVERVVDGNLALVDPKYHRRGEREELIKLMEEFKILPAGRHLWASGVKGRQYLFNPVTGDSEVVTRDGVRKISELVGRTVEVLSMSDNCSPEARVWESVGAWRKAVFIDSGVQPTYRVTFESGREVVTTAEHVWYSMRSRTKLTTLQLVGEKIPVMAAPRPAEDGDYWVGVMRGIIYGDGSTTSDTPTGEPGKAYIRIHADEKRELLGIFEKFGHRVQVHADGVGYVGRLPRAWKRELPSLEESASYWRGFFAGWFAADGCVDTRGVATLHCADKGALDYARQGFLKAGLITSVATLAREKSPFDGSDKPLYRLSFKRFCLTGDDFLVSAKRERFEANPARLRVVGDRVVSVEPTGREEQVFCCLEPETKSWTVNGVLTGNCHVSGMGETPWEHFEFTFLRLMEGGGVGANYSNRFLSQYPSIKGAYRVHIVCDPEHPDYQKMKDAGVLSDEYDSDWEGSFEVEDSREGWAAALVDLVSTYYRHAENVNRVFDVSRVRAEGSRLKTFGGRASGPLPLAQMLIEVSEILNRRVYQQLDGIGAMEIDHAIAKCVVSGGNRRSARMAIMHWDDPQIEEFIRIKQDTGEHWTTNISVEVDDYFWGSIESPDDDERSRAQFILKLIAEGMLTNGEPGFWDSSYSNAGESGEVIATNPCGEIPLEAWENCNLGHVNLAAFVENGTFNKLECLRAHWLMTRFLIRATFGDVNDSKQAERLAQNRRIGVGHFGFASAMAKMGIKYSEASQSESIRDLLYSLGSRVRDGARNYAFELRIPEPVKVTTVAPTGTIAKLPGVSEGIHPIFARYFIRRIRFSTVDPEQWQTCLDYAAQGYKVEEDQYADNTMVVEIPTKDSLFAEVEELYGTDRAEEIVQSAADLTLEEMLSVQEMYQTYWADNAVSYTANVDPDRYSVEDLARTLWRFGGVLKGATIFPEQSMPQAPYERITREQYEEATAKSVADSVDEECASGACPVR